MKRRTLKQLRSKLESLDHHNVYVVLLDPAVGKLRKVRAENPKRDPKKPCVYVGMSGLSPEERFANHKAGIKDASVVKRYGIRLLPELYAHLNPMPYEATAQMEKDLAEDLRRAGYMVTGNRYGAMQCLCRTTSSPRLNREWRIAAHRPPRHQTGTGTHTSAPTATAWTPPLGRNFRVASQVGLGGVIQTNCLSMLSASL
jgi:hypothetical protein